MYRQLFFFCISMWVDAGEYDDDDDAKKTMRLMKNFASLVVGGLAYF